MIKFLRWAWALLYLLTAIAASAQKLTTLVRLQPSEGFNPQAELVQGSDGSFYGTAAWGGNLPCYSGTGCGTVFKFTPHHGLIILHTFCTQPNCPDGAEPYAGLIQASDGNFYGTTVAGGSGHCNDFVIPGCGTVFKISPRGKLTTLHSICMKPNCYDGAQPLGGLIEGRNGKFYGTTSGGGIYGAGTVFEITRNGKLTTIHSFIGSDGSRPASRGSLVRSMDGNFYGTTAAGGTSADGTVFRVTPRGKLTTLYSFCTKFARADGKFGCIDGKQPLSSLIQDPNGDFLGTTFDGGAYGAGTVFRITPRGDLTTLYSFCALKYCPDGAEPFEGLVLGSDGNFYGTTYSNGVHGLGTIFRIKPDGSTLTTLYNFCAKPNCSDGALPAAALIQARDREFYGTTSSGGIKGGMGTLFRLDVGLGNRHALRPNASAIRARFRKQTSTLPVSTSAK